MISNELRFDLIYPSRPFSQFTANAPPILGLPPVLNPARMASMVYRWLFTVLYALHLIWTGLQANIQAQAYKPNALWFCLVLGLMALAGAFLFRLNQTKAARSVTRLRRLARFRLLPLLLHQGSRGGRHDARRPDPPQLHRRGGGRVPARGTAPR